jgi:hypothetical protein
LLKYDVTFWGPLNEQYENQTWLLRLQPLEMLEVVSNIITSF